MTRRVLFWLCLCVMEAAASAAAASDVRFTRGQFRGWNVVWIVLDATSAQRLGAYGGPGDVMPFLNSLANRGVVVDHAYATTGSTAPSIASMLTGLDPLAHGVTYNGVKLNPEVRSLPEVLKRYGYATGGVTEAFFLSERYNFGGGWDHFDAPQPTDSSHVSNEAILPRVENALSRLPKGKPFFLWVHMKGGHAPLAPVRKEYLHRFAPDLDSDAAPERPSTYDAAMEAKTLRVWRAFYDATLNEADAALARLFSMLDTAGRSAKTLFVISADHGESFERGLIGEHWPSPWESTLRIPLLLYSKSNEFPRGRISKHLVTTMDLAPTLLDLLGIIDRLGSGVSFRGEVRRSNFTAASVSALVAEDVVRRRLSPTVSDNELKTLKSTTAELKRSGVFYWAYFKQLGDGRILKLLYLRGTGGAREAKIHLFEVTSDPSESRDLAATNRRLVHRLLREVRTHQPLFGMIPPRESDLDTLELLLRGLTSEEVQKLRALGYIQ